MKTIVNSFPIHRAHPRGALLALTKRWGATCRISALAASLLLAAAPRAQAGAGTLVSWGEQWIGHDTPAGIFTAVAVGSDHNVGIKADGTLLVWNWEINYGESVTPTVTFSAVAAGFFYSMGIRTDGTLVFFGPQSFVTPAGTFTTVAAGFSHGVGIRTDGTLASWGENEDYALVSSTPTGTFTAVAAGAYHSVGIRTDGTIVSWGDGHGWGDDSGDLVSGAPTGTFTAVGAGVHHSVGIRTDGTLVSWGFDEYGQVSGTPTGTFIAVAAGHWFSVGIRTDGTFVSWGNDNRGEVSGTPAGTFSAVAAGGFHSLAIRSVYSWTGVLQPINADGSSVFKAGSTVPVKFQLTGASAGLTDAVATLSYAKVSNSLVGSINEGTSNAAASAGNQFRFDPTSGQYIYNWSTKGLNAGIYQLQIALGDGVSRTVNVALK